MGSLIGQESTWLAMLFPLITQAEARRLILAEWRKWPKLSNPAGSNEMFAFYRRLKNEQPELLSFRCREDKWRRVREWLLDAMQ